MIGSVRVDEKNGDRAAKRLAPSDRAALLFVKDSVETVLEVEVIHLACPDRGEARPAVEVVEVVQEGSIQAKEVVFPKKKKAKGVAVSTGTAVEHMQTCLTVALLVVIIGQPGGAAMDCVWALELDGLDHALHGVAPDVTTPVGKATTYMARAVGLDLLMAHRAHHMPRFIALHGSYANSIHIKINN
jgi:hypothetical protein